MYVCVLPRAWYVRVRVFPMWRVVCTYVSYLEDGMYEYVCFLCGGCRGWHVRVCVFSMWRVVCTYVSYLEDGMYVYVCFLCGGWYVRMCLT